MHMSASATTHLLLDYMGDALLPAGYDEVTTEVAWLEAASALPDGSTAPPLILVRGAELCGWAKVWWEARGGEINKCASPSKELLQVCSKLTIEQAKLLLQELPASQKASNSVELLTVLYPATVSWLPISAHPTADILQKHLAHWLLWVADQTAGWPEHHRPVVQVVAAAYQMHHPQVAPLWLTDPTEAAQAIRQWLGVAPEGSIQAVLVPGLSWLGAFPLALPPTWQEQVRSAFAESLPTLTADSAAAVVATQAWWAQHLRPEQPAAVRVTAAHVLADFVRNNPAAASLALLKSLETELPPALINQLRPLVAPPVPPPLPTSPAEVLTWTTQAYLPYRQWQVANKQAAATKQVGEAAREFGNWLLQVYPTQLLDAAHPYQQLYWSKQANRPGPNEVVIWVIADGLGWADAQNLLRLIADESANKSNGTLAATLAQPCFGLLPTITSHTKEPLRWGVPFSHLAEADTTAPPDLKSNANLAAAAAKAQPGSLLVWRPYDPDPIYHQQVDADVARDLVQGALYTLATRIATAANAVPPGPAVRVLITTDHGRLLSDSPREMLAPSTCKVEGRTAHLMADAPAIRPAPDTDEVRWLDPKLFCLPNWVGVALGEAAFRIPVGETTHGGRAPYPHGGVWPEEVVLPWLELVRDAGPVKVTASLNGAGRAGFPGVAQLRLRNDSRHHLTVVHVSIRFGAATPHVVLLHQPSVPLKTIDVSIDLLSWPHSSEVQSGQLVIVVETADGKQASFPVEANLTNTGLQDRGVDIGAEFGF